MSDGCDVTGDEILLEQVMVNLLINAMDAMALTPVSERRIVVRTAVTRHGAEVSVEDHVAGIAAEVQARLFEPFVTTKPHGIGLGLPIIRGIVEAHGGTIRAANNPNGGARFWFTLPV